MSTSGNLKDKGERIKDDFTSASDRFPTFNPLDLVYKSQRLLELNH
jgi:hypothetical protein